MDHIVELLDGGAPFEPSNPQAACVPCNTRKMQAAKKARPRRYIPRREWGPSGDRCARARNLLGSIGRSALRIITLFVRVVRPPAVARGAAW